MCGAVLILSWKNGKLPQVKEIENLGANRGGCEEVKFAMWPMISCAVICFGLWRKADTNIWNYLRCHPWGQGQALWHPEDSDLEWNICQLRRCRYWMPSGCHSVEVFRPDLTSGDLIADHEHAGGITSLMQPWKAPGSPRKSCRTWLRKRMWGCLDCFACFDRCYCHTDTHEVKDWILCWFKYQAAHAVTQ